MERDQHNEEKEKFNLMRYSSSANGSLHIVIGSLGAETIMPMRKEQSKDI